MADQILTCPYCARQYAIQPGQVAAYVGQQVPCTVCKGVFLVTQNGPTLQAVPTTPPAPAFPAPAAPAPMPYAPASGGQTNGLALAGMICGIAGFLSCGLASIAGLICSIMGLQKSKQTGTGRGMAITGIVLSSLSLFLVVPALLISILLPSLARAREKANMVKCASNLRQIGQASLLYAMDNTRQGGPHGPSFDALVATQPISPSVFVCPSDSSSGTGQLASGACSYVWVGANLKVNSNPECVLAYEPLSNHGGEGSNILFADGHVEFISATQAKSIISDLTAGRNPPAVNVPTAR